MGNAWGEGALEKCLPSAVKAHLATVPKALPQGRDRKPRTLAISVSDIKHRTSLRSETITFAESA